MVGAERFRDRAVRIGNKPERQVCATVELLNFLRSLADSDTDNVDSWLESLPDLLLEAWQFFQETVQAGELEPVARLPSCANFPPSWKPSSGCASATTSSVPVTACAGSRA